MHLFADSQSALNIAFLVLRVAVATSFLVHGMQKWAMWKMQPSEQLPLPMLSILRLLSIVEPLGGLALASGFLTQWAAAGFIIIMLGAIRLKSLKMHKKFTGDGGWELDYLLLAMALSLVLLGGGRLALDSLL
ncbi:MAG TPA: DoxX family protein [Bacteroidota bacterium]|nr:DoxX family protein [Bacteroidota bacterium]